MTSQAIFIISISSLFYIYEFFLRVMPSVITQELMMEFQVNASMMSFMTSCFLYSYAMMQIPAGILIDRYGPKTVLTFAVTICAIATLLFQSTTDIHVAIVSRLLLGAASSVAFIAPLTLASRWFKPQYLALIAGCVQVLGCLGAILGGAPIAYINTQIGWRTALLWASLIGFFLAIIFWLTIKDQPSKSNIGTTPTLKDSFKQINLIIRNKQNLYIALAAFSSWCAVGALAELWGVPFLSKFHAIKPTEAASLIIVIWVGVALGSPLSGWWSDKINNHRIPLITLLSLSILTTLIVVYTYNISKIFLLLNLFVMGFAAGAQPITFSLIAIHNPPSRIGTAFGFNNMAVVCSASLLQPSIGYLLDYFWDGNFDGTRIYSILAYQKSLSIVVLAIMLGIIASKYFIQEQQRITRD